MYQEGLTLKISDDDIRNFLQCPLLMYVDDSDFVMEPWQVIRSVFSKLLMHELRHGSLPTYGDMTSLFANYWLMLKRRSKKTYSDKLHNTMLMLTIEMYDWILSNKFIPLASNVALTYEYSNIIYTTSVDFIVRHPNDKVYAILITEEVYNKAIVMRQTNIRASISIIKDTIAAIDGVIIIAISGIRINYYTYDTITKSIIQSGFTLLNSVLDAISNTTPYPNYTHCYKCKRKDECINESHTELPQRHIERLS